MADQAEAEFTDSQIEAGRLLFAQGSDFVLGAARLDQLPEPLPCEVAFAGRSNVGKSSLLNALTGRKALARTSNTPGRTRELNYFQVGSVLHIVDMPGYGYARAEKALVAKWQDLIRKYLGGRPNLRRVFVLIDSRHGLKANDLEIMDLLDEAAVIYQVVLTKVDKLKKGELDKVVSQVREGLRKRPAAHPELHLTSSAKGTGIAELRADIAVLSGAAE
ncbi:MAG: ribosome biogenesis GTP-binding protein YihA/YsxC [Pseudomonadota bacterium]